MDQFAAKRNAQKLSIRYVSGLRNHKLFCPNKFRVPCNHPTGRSTSRSRPKAIVWATSTRAESSDAGPLSEVIDDFLQVASGPESFSQYRSVDPIVAPGTAFCMLRLQHLYVVIAT